MEAELRQVTRWQGVARCCTGTAVLLALCSSSAEMPMAPYKFYFRLYFIPLKLALSILKARLLILKGLG